ncbi:MAG: alpha/beta hydrolase, partial [Campylobacterota bacterium]|nr:alpha/beta hydrolase [Campylobacterota bacterium]
MFIITNRRVSKKKGDFSIFKKTPNPKGPNELRLLEMVSENGKKIFTLLNDKISKKQARTMNEDYNLNLDTKQNWPMSLEVACRIFNEAKSKEKHILVYVHGYNNDMKDIVTTAEKLENAYNVIVVIFSWPANGGGFFSGTAQYVGDKSDARVSTGALNSFFNKLHSYHAMLTSAEVDSLWDKAKEKYRDNYEE